MGFVTRSGSQFMLDGKKFRFIGMNYYPLVIGPTSQANIRTLFSQLRSRNIRVVRCWCFDPGYLPSDSGMNFRFLDYPLGTNLLSNYSFESGTSGWTVGTDWSRINSDSYDGSYSMKQVSTGGYSSISTPFTVTANTNYVLTFWAKVSNPSGFPPVTFIGTTAGNNDVKDGGYTYDTAGEWKRTQIPFNSGNNTTLYLAFQNWSGTVTRYVDNVNISVQQTPTLSWRESSLQQLDLVLDEAKRYRIKLILSLADDPTYRTKETYISWANTINGAGLSTSYPYSGFFTSSYCKQMYKDFAAGLINRTNTVNGTVYKNDDSIFSWELGNELRVNGYGTNDNSLSSSILGILSSSGGWVDVMSTYIKSIDPNHLVGFSSMSHGYAYSTGDNVWNGTYYGVDYNVLTQLTNIDYLDAHCYPTQGGGEVNLLEYGQHLGYPDAISGPGFAAQLQDYVTVAHNNGKPAIIGEIGFVKEVIASTTHYPLYPRAAAFDRIFHDFLEFGGDGILLWSAVTDPTGGSYSIVLNGVADTITNLNTDDRPLMTNIHERNSMINNKRIPVI